MTRKRDGSWTVEYRDANGELHRDDDLPAVEQFRADGSAANKVWFQHGKVHRAEGMPAVVRVADDGSMERRWYEQDELLREEHVDSVLSAQSVDGGPAVIEYGPEGDFRLREWRHKGRLHREGGPARIFVNAKGVEVQEWYRGGAQVEPPSSIEASEDD